MKSQFCKIGAVNSDTPENHTNISLLNQYEVFKRRAFESIGTPLQSFFESKAQKIKRILEGRRS